MEHELEYHDSKSNAMRKPKAQLTFYNLINLILCFDCSALAVTKSELSEGSNEGSPHGKAESSQLALKLLSFRDHCLYTDN